MNLTKILGKTKELGIGVLASGIIALTVCSNYELEVGVYQGSKRDWAYPGKNIYVFDSKNLDKREEKPAYILEGTLSLEDSLKIREEYLFVMRNSKEIIHARPTREIKDLINDSK